jgi:hypothetical protein
LSRLQICLNTAQVCLFGHIAAVLVQRRGLCTLNLSG